MIDAWLSWMPTHSSKRSKHVTKSFCCTNNTCKVCCYRTNCHNSYCTYTFCNLVYIMIQIEWYIHNLVFFSIFPIILRRCLLRKYSIWYLILTRSKILFSWLEDIQVFALYENRTCDPLTIARYCSSKILEK